MAGNTKKKAQRIEENRDKRPYAVARHIRISSYKVGIVLDLIRNKSVVEAIAILDNTDKSASRPIKKVLLSATANAENNPQHGFDRNDLFVAECYAGQGPVLKRVMPRARGRASSILKRTSHITVVLDSKNK